MTSFLNRKHFISLYLICFLVFSCTAPVLNQKSSNSTANTSSINEYENQRINFLKEKLKREFISIKTLSRDESFNIKSLIRTFLTVTTGCGIEIPVDQTDEEIPCDNCPPLPPDLKPIVPDGYIAYYGENVITFGSKSFTVRPSTSSPSLELYLDSNSVLLSSNNKINLSVFGVTNDRWNIKIVGNRNLEIIECQSNFSRLDSNYNYQPIEWTIPNDFPSGRYEVIAYLHDAPNISVTKYLDIDNDIYPSSPPSSPPPNNPCNNKNILPTDVQNLSNTIKSVLPPLDEAMNNTLELSGIDRKIQNLNTQIQNLTQRLSDKGFSVNAFNPQPLRDKINELKAQISQLQADKQNKINNISNKTDDINSYNQNIINESNTLTDSNDILNVYTLSDFNSFKEKAEELRYDFEDYVSSENTYGLIEASKIISKETSLFNNLVSVYASGVLPETIDNNDELPQYQDDETGYDKIQKPRQLIKWLNSRIKAHTNILENKRAKLEQDVNSVNSSLETIRNDILRINASLDAKQILIDKDKEKLEEYKNTFNIQMLPEPQSSITPGSEAEQADVSAARADSMIGQLQGMIGGANLILGGAIPNGGGGLNGELQRLREEIANLKKMPRTPENEVLINQKRAEFNDKFSQKQEVEQIKKQKQEILNNLTKNESKEIKSVQKNAHDKKFKLDSACKSQACRPGNAKFTPEEREQRMIDYLSSKGLIVKKNPMEGQVGAGRQPDFIVEGTGQRLELKTLGVESEPNIKTIENSLNKSIRRGGQARDMVYDARNTILQNRDTALEWTTKGMNSSQNMKEKIDSVRLIGDNYDFTASRNGSSFTITNN